MIEGGAARPGLHVEVHVVCPHNREKRSELTLEFDPYDFDPKRYTPVVCECCENIYLHDTKEGVFARCEPCRGVPTYAIAVPLPEEGAR